MSKNPKNGLSLKKVNDDDLNFLYCLLKERNAIQNISHKKMPSYREHVKFVRSKPYSFWYIVKLNKERVGSVYLSTLNEIGLHLKKDYDNDELGGKVLQLIMKKHPRRRYLSNVNPQNKKRMRLLRAEGFKLIQYTYELTK